MAVHVGRFATGTGAVSTEINLGVPFVPNAIIFITSGATGTGNTAAAGARLGYGFVAANGQRAVASHLQDNIGDNNQTGMAVAADCCVMHISTGTTIDGKLSVKSLAGGVVLEVTYQYTTSRDVTFLAIGGIKAEVGDFALSAGTGSQSVTGHSFQGNAILFGNIAQTITSYPGSATEVHIGLGFAASSVQGTIHGWSRVDNGTESSDGKSYGYNGECLTAGLGSSTNVFNRASFTSFNADGFTINKLERNNATRFPYLLMGNDAADIAGFVFNTPTNTSEFSVTTPIDPEGLFLFSHLQANSTQDTSIENARLSFGVATADGQRAVAAKFQKTDAASNISRGQRSANGLQKLSVSADSNTRLLTVNSFGTGQFLAQMSETGETGAFQVFGLAFSESEAEAPANGNFFAFF